jgi:hypothetical protein
MLANNSVMTVCIHVSHLMMFPLIETCIGMQNKANSKNKKKTQQLRGFGPLANYADRATAASWQSSTNFCGQRVLRGQRNGCPRSYSRFS